MFHHHQSKLCIKVVVQVLRNAVNEVSVANPKITRFGILLPIKNIKDTTVPFSPLTIVVLHCKSLPSTHKLLCVKEYFPQNEKGMSLKNSLSFLEKILGNWLHLENMFAHSDCSPSLSVCIMQKAIFHTEKVTLLIYFKFPPRSCYNPLTGGSFFLTNIV